ncbi:MAG: hypothetical protein LBC77_06055 [Spirochaetaceae bacterium]|jgi:hypothetical protein|nr:hypothetical protein [Spirochaetaceae bacterium]
MLVWRAVFCVLFFLCAAFTALAQDKGISLSTGASFKTLGRPSFGIRMQVEYFPVSYFSVMSRGGMDSTGFFDTDGEEVLVNYELGLDARFYIPHARRYFLSFFVQAGVGIFAIQRDKDAKESYSGLCYGGGLGFRFFFPHRMFAELYAQAGYPYLMDTGLLFGIHSGS